MDAEEGAGTTGEVATMAVTTREVGTVAVTEGETEVRINVNGYKSGSRIV